MFSLYCKPSMQMISICVERIPLQPRGMKSLLKDKQKSSDLAESSFCGRRIQTFEKFRYEECGCRRSSDSSHGTSSPPWNHRKGTLHTNTQIAKPTPFMQTGERKQTHREERDKHSMHTREKREKWTVWISWRMKVQGGVQTASGQTERSEEREKEEKL